MMELQVLLFCHPFCPLDLCNKVDFSCPDCTTDVAFFFLTYTLLLLLSQWLQPKSHLLLLSWVRNPRLKTILKIASMLE